MAKGEFLTGLLPGETELGAGEFPWVTTVFSWSLLSFSKAAEVFRRRDSLALHIK